MSAALRRRYGHSGTGALAPDKALVQALLFPKENWTASDARVWAELHGFKSKHYDETDSYVRIHPSGNKVKAARVRTMPYGIGGIRAVVEWRLPKKGKK